MAVRSCVLFFLLAAWTGLAAGLAPAVSAEVGRCAPPAVGLSYKIFNDEDDVGALTLKVTRQSGTTTLDVAMDISLRLFAIQAYEYRHRSRETWAGGALVRSQGRSVDNGQTKEVEMKNLGDRYLVLSDDGPIRQRGVRLSELIWCEALARSGRVISTLTGSVDDYPFHFVGAEALVHNGRTVPTRHYRFRRKKRSGDIWYDGDGVALRVTYPTRYFTLAAFVRND